MQAQMQAQTYTLRPFANTASSSNRAAGVGLVIALHVGLVIALIYGLKVTFTPAPPKDLTGGVIIDQPVKPHVDPPPPVNPNWTNTQVHIDPPIIDTTPEQQGDNGHGINATFGPGNTVALPQPTPAQGIMATHTIPPYPATSITMAEEGVVALRVAISDEGFVTDATVVRSSGHTRLDAAAVAWVKAHWRYRPALAQGRAVASTAQAEVRFELH